jgi:radical SAM protein with 4Fe4S-binding SPASM domain
MREIVTARPRFPPFVHIETTTFCRNGCGFCPRERLVRPEALMSDETFDKTVDELAPHAGAIRRIYLYMQGEPLTDPALCERIRALKARGLGEVFVSTRGTSLDVTGVRDLAAAGLDRLRISLNLAGVRVDADRPAVAHMPGFAELLRSLAAQGLRGDSTPAVHLQLIQDEDDDALARRFAQACSALGFRGPIDRVPAHNYGGHLAKRQCPEVDAFTPLPCLFLWTKLVIHIDGTMPLCCFDLNADHPIGNIHDGKVAAAWTSEAMQRYRRLHAVGEMVGICRRCSGVRLVRDADAWLRCYRGAFDHGALTNPLGAGHERD